MRGFPLPQYSPLEPGLFLPLGDTALLRKVAETYPSDVLAGDFVKPLRDRQTDPARSGAANDGVHERHRHLLCGSKSTCRRPKKRVAAFVVQCHADATQAVVAKPRPEQRVGSGLPILRVLHDAGQRVRQAGRLHHCPS
jgi:hypothetical protein